MYCASRHGWPGARDAEVVGGSGGEGAAGTGAPAGGAVAVGAHELVADPDRERVAALLTAAAGDGLLTLTEADERLARTWAARTGAELTAVTADLPVAWLRRRRQEEAAAGAARLAAASLPGHVRTYLAVMALLVTIWLLTGAGYPWPVWPALGMGIGVLGHARSARALRRGRPLPG